MGLLKAFQGGQRGFGQGPWKWNVHYLLTLQGGNVALGADIQFNYGKVSSAAAWWIVVQCNHVYTSSYNFSVVGPALSINVSRRPLEARKFVKYNYVPLLDRKSHKATDIKRRRQDHVKGYKTMPLDWVHTFETESGLFRLYWDKKVQIKLHCLYITISIRIQICLY